MPGMEMFWRTLFARVSLCILFACAATGSRSQNLYRGLLHAHTSFSDGSGLPAEAFSRAASKGLDFFAITEHNHAEAEAGAKERADGLLIALDARLYNASAPFAPAPGKPKVKSVVLAASEATTPSFVAIAGQEFSTISSGNHVNVLGVEQVLDISNGKFDSLFDFLATEAQAGRPYVVQLNHPDVHEDLFYGGSAQKIRKKMNNDYGLDDYNGSFERLVEASDRFVCLIEVLTGPAMAKNRKASYPYRDLEDDYYFYLSQGWHLSPSVGHDNHYRTWGDATDARMGVYSAGLDRGALVGAFRANRTFASEDVDLALHFQLGGDAMGSCVAKAADDKLVFSAEVEDPSDSDTAVEIALLHGRVEQQMIGALTELTADDGELETLEVTSGVRQEFQEELASGEPEFFYVRVTQADGDRAWSAPIWLNHPRSREAAPMAPVETATYVWTTGHSAYYHQPWCPVVASIKAKNRAEGPSPPEGRRLHGCERPEGEPGH